MKASVSFLHFEKPLKCITFNFFIFQCFLIGMKYKAGEQWSNGDNGCLKCKCAVKGLSTGVIECMKPKCPKLVCPKNSYVHLEGELCFKMNNVFLTFTVYAKNCM